MTRRQYAAAVVVTCAVGLAMRSWFGATQFIGYDGFWHVFVSRQPLWQKFMAEVGGTAHPPLYFLLLRASQWLFGVSRLSYRLVSTVAGIGMIAVSSHLVLKAGGSRVAAAAAAIIVALSEDAVMLSEEVRAYALATFFLVLAADFALSLASAVADDRRVRNGVLGFGVCSTLALATSYSSIFAIGAIAVAIVAAAAADRSREIAKRLRAHVIELTAVCGFIVAASAFVYFVHIRKWSGVLSHLKTYYRDAASESIAGFVVRTSAEFVNLFSPVTIASAPLAVAILALLVTALVVVAAVSLRDPVAGEESERPSPAIPVLITLVIFAGLLVGGITDKYPYGGALRQQFVIFPFLVVALVTSAELLIRRMTPASMQARAVAVGAGLAIALALLSGSAWWFTFPRVPKELFTNEIAAFSSHFAKPPAVYLDQFSTIGFFSQTSGNEWVFEHDLPELSGVEQYRMHGDRYCAPIVRDHATWNADILDEAFYSRLHAILVEAQEPEIVVFHKRQAPLPPSTPAASIPAVVDASALRAGLKPDSVYVGDTGDLYAKFSLARPQEITEAASVQALDPAQQVGRLWAEPNPIPVCDGSRLGDTMIRWKTDRQGFYVIRTGTPGNSAVFGEVTTEGHGRTGKWIHDRTRFYVVDAPTGHVVATLLVRVNTDCSR